MSSVKLLKHPDVYLQNSYEHVNFLLAISGDQDTRIKPWQKMYFDVDTKRYKNLMKRLCESVSKKLCE